MAKYVVKYLLEGAGTIPSAIQDGGYFPVGNELVGVTYDDTERYVSSSFTKLTKADLSARLASMNPKNQDGSAMTSDQQAALITAWLAQVGMSNLS
jgi:hypothetical protein